MPLNHCHESIKTIRSNHCKPLEREEFDKNPRVPSVFDFISRSTFSFSPLLFFQTATKKKLVEGKWNTKGCVCAGAEDATSHARGSRASGKRRNYVIPGRYARHATDSNPVKRSPFGLRIPYVLPLSHLSQREIPQPERACRRNRRASAGACAQRLAWNRETMKIPPISAYLEILPFSDFSPSPSFYKRTRVECSATGVPRGTIEKFISDLIFRK